MIKKLAIGEISEPFESRDEHANVIYKVVKIKNILPSHKANLVDDYDIVQRMTKQSRENDIFMKWVKDKQRLTYIKIDPDFKNCDFSSKGWIK